MFIYIYKNTNTIIIYHHWRLRVSLSTLKEVYSVVLYLITFEVIFDRTAIFSAYKIDPYYDLTELLLEVALIKR